jgi:hypothetical protein
MSSVDFPENIPPMMTSRLIFYFEMGSFLKIRVCKRNTLKTCIVMKKKKMYTDPLYNIRMESQRITNENLRVFYERPTTDDKTKVTKAVALGARKHSKRMGGSRRVLPVHALQCVQTVQKKEHAIQSSYNCDKHGHRDGQLCTDDISFRMAKVCALSHRSS